MKKMYKVFIVLAITAFVVLALSNYVQAADDDLSWKAIQDKASEFETKGDLNKKVLDASAPVNGVANVLTTIGVVFVLGALLILGIKYMMATPDDAAKLKKQLVGVAISGIVIIGAFGIWMLTRTILSNVTGSKNGALVKEYMTQQGAQIALQQTIPS